MDFFIKSSFASTQSQEKNLDLESSGLIEGFFDDYRVLIMALALILSLINFIWQIKKYKEDKKEHKSDRDFDHSFSIKESYWNQSVILPLFVDKFVECVSNWINTINNLKVEDGPSIDNTRDSFKKDIRELCSRTHLLCTVDENVRENIRLNLDSIEDCITAYLSDLKEQTNAYKPSSINEKVFIKVNEIVNELMHNHQKIISDTA